MGDGLGWFLCSGVICFLFDLVSSSVRMIGRLYPYYKRVFLIVQIYSNSLIIFFIRSNSLLSYLTK